MTFGVLPMADRELRLSNEHKELGRFAPAEIGGLNMPEGYRRSIRDWVSSGCGAVGRKDGRWRIPSNSSWSRRNGCCSRRMSNRSWCPAREGDFGVLPGHARLISTVRPGVISVFQGGKVTDRIFVEGGFAEVTGTGCTVLAEHAIPVSDIQRDQRPAGHPGRPGRHRGRQGRRGPQGGRQGPGSGRGPVASDRRGCLLTGRLRGGASVTCLSELRTPRLTSRSIPRLAGVLGDWEPVMSVQS